MLILSFTDYIKQNENDFFCLLCCLNQKYKEKTINKLKHLEKMDSIHMTLRGDEHKFESRKLDAYHLVIMFGVEHSWQADVIDWGEILSWGEGSGAGRKMKWGDGEGGFGAVLW